MEIVISIGLVTFGIGIGWELAKRFAHPHSEYPYVEITPEEIEAHIRANEFLRSRAQHPSNRRFRHPEMEEEDDC